MSVEIHNTAIIDKDAEIGDGSTIGPFAIIGPKVKLGKNNTVGAYSHIQRNTTLGDDNKLDSYVSLGGDPQDLSFNGADTFLEIGNGNTFREYVHINRGTQEASVTRLGNNCYLMGGAHVGHNVTVADDVIMVTHAGIGGHAQIGRNAFIAAYSAIHQHCKIGAFCMLGFLTKVTQDIPPFTTSVGATDSVVVGLNAIGLKRGGFTPEERKTIKQIFKIFYQSKLPRKEAMVQIEALGDSRVVKEWVDFVNDSTRGIIPFGSHTSGG